MHAEQVECARRVGQLLRIPLFELDRALTCGKERRVVAHQRLERPLKSSVRGPTCSMVGIADLPLAIELIAHLDDHGAVIALADVLIQSTASEG